MTAAPDSNPPGELYCTACEKTFHVGDRCPVDGTRLLKLKARIDPFLGRDLDGRYTVLEKLGSGGMGAVYRAEQHSVDREVAIKVINSTLVSEPEVIKRFLREAKLASKLSHPNAVGVMDFGQTDDGVFYLVMELVTGRTLDDVIKAERMFRPERVVRIGIQICDALEGAHELQIIHRDLKPANIMLMASGRDLVKVLDFGLAKSTSPDQTSTTMTGAGAVVGTPAFMPPELATGEPCDARSDLYSLGVILYLLGSGRLPFMSESVHELLALHASDEPAPPMTGVPARLARVIDKLLAKRPADRYQSAVEARNALEESLTLQTPGPHNAPNWPNDTNPSIGPFPATTAQFAGFETPVPPSLVAETQRKKPKDTAMQRIMTGETMLAAGGTAPASSQPGLASLPSYATPKKARWPLFAAAGAVILGSIVAIGMTRGKADEPTQPPPAKPPIELVGPKAPIETSPGEARTVKPPETGSASTPVPPPPASDAGSAAPPVEPKKPPKSNRPPRGNKPPKVTRPPVEPKGSGEPKDVKTVPPPPPSTNGTGSGTKPPALPF